MKRIITLSLILTLLLALCIYGVLKYQKFQKDRGTLFPRFNTGSLMAGSEHVPYEADIFGSLIGAKAKLEITTLKMPAGLNLEGCDQTNNLSSLPRPNSMIHCTLKGTMPKGTYPIELEISASGYYSKVVQNYDLRNVSMI